MTTMYRMRNLIARLGLLAALAFMVLAGCQKEEGTVDKAKRLVEISVNAPTVLSSPRLVQLEGKVGTVELTREGETLRGELAPGVYPVAISGDL